MPNEPDHAKKERNPPARRQNAQDDREGSAHDPEKFDVMNSQMQVHRERDRIDKPKVPPKDR